MKARKHHLNPALACALALLALSLSLRADDDSPDANKWHLTSIDWVHHHQDELSLDVKPATLIGRALRQYEHFVYIFSDGTGTIELYSEIQLPMKTPIVIRGNIDESTFNVESWRPLDKVGETLK